MPEAFRLALLSLLRDRFALALLVIAPTVFLGVTWLTAPLMLIPISFFGLPGIDELPLRQREVLVAFISSSVGGFLSAFLASEILSDRRDLGKLLIFSGLPAARWAGARLLAALTVAGGVALWTFALEAALIPLRNPAATLLGALLLALVYGLFGATVGLLARDTLRSVLCILILADVDAAWLQNPVYYTYAQENEIVHRLPAFHPIQETLAGAFAGRFNFEALVGSLAYAALLCLPLLLALAWRYGPVEISRARSRRESRGGRGPRP